MAKEDTALDRLNRYNEPSTEREFTVEEQLSSISTDDFLDDMSSMAKSEMSQFIEEVTLDNTEESIEQHVEESIDKEVTIDENIEQTSYTETIDQPVEIEEPKMNNEGLFNNNSADSPTRRGRRSSTQKVNQQTTNDVQKNPIFDQLAKDIIDNLRKQKLKINRFDDASMEMIFSYMYSKF